MYFASVFTLAVAVVSTSASLVARQSVPTCASSCIAHANLNGCISSDTHCLCTNQVFVSSTTQCIVAACTGSDLQAAIQFSQGLCLAVGVTLTGTIPSSTATSTQPASSSTSAPATTSKAAAATHGANAFVGLAAVGLVALAL